MVTTKQKEVGMFDTVIIGAGPAGMTAPFIQHEAI